MILEMKISEAIIPYSKKILLGRNIELNRKNSSTDVYMTPALE